MTNFSKGIWWFVRNFLFYVIIIASLLFFVFYVKDASAKNLFNLFEDRPEYDFVSKDTVFVEYPEDEYPFIEACKVDAAGVIQDCWIINWEDARECLEKRVIRKNKPVPVVTPDYEDLMKPKD